MKTSRLRIARIIASNLLKNGESEKYVQSIASFLLSEQRTGELDSLLRDVQANWAEAGHVEVSASSAHPLTSDIRQQIITQAKQVYPRARDITIDERHDPDLIGGVRVELPGLQLDLSLEAKLHKFKQLAGAGKV